VGCGRPICIPPPANLLADTDGLPFPAPEVSAQNVPIWGLPSSCGVSSSSGKGLDSSARANLVVFLPNKAAYHRVCFDLKKKTGSSNGM
jgi:hypothetical protein